MPNNTAVYIFNRILRTSILLFILYLIFTNFGTFLIIVSIFFISIAFLIYNFKKKLSTRNFHFQFNNKEFFEQNSNFNDFRNFNFNTNSYTNQNEVEKAKEFFGFTQTPTKEELKKRYKELARKYHPDINQGDDKLMKDLNHYRDVLTNIAI